MTGQRWGVVPLCGAALAVALCLVAARQAGYPLDDSWIHQDFARTLATAHQFAFAPGRSGAGSTSPLWVLLLTPPYLIFGSAPPLAVVVGWTSLLGAAALAALAVVTGMAAGEVAQRASADERMRRLAALLASLAVISEWHLVWAAASGMETVLFCALVMAVLLLISRGAPPWVLGLLIALTIAARPEGAALAILAVVAELRAPLGERPAVRLTALRAWAVGWALPFAVTLLLGVAPYLLLNLRASGHLLPSTIAAKAAYYGGAGLLPALASYAAQVVVILLVSSPVLVLLGALSYSQRLLTPQAARAHPVGADATECHSRRESHHSPRVLIGLLIAWPALLLVAYAGRLPVLYHNGRYLMPALPPLLALGAAGALPLLVQWRRPLARAALALVAVAGVASLARGAQIYGDNVRFINGCQVTTAQWLSLHTRPGALIATHDIGAIGYFARRPVVDIAGLVDPQITPMLSDQPRLERYLKARHVAYVVEFTDWFGPPNSLAHDLASHQVYHAGGGARFVVFRTDW
ncbi:MAG TPA: hypothetical protein VGR57_04770 [Ktedonobacterales bacterium]|nr:hypothetical protein [Ktedonobacterales bacterium]